MTSLQTGVISTKKQPKNHIPMFWRLMAWIMASLFALLSIALALTLRYSLNTLQQKIDEILQSSVQTFAESPSVLEALRNGECSPVLKDFLDDVVRNTGDLDYMTIADNNSIRIYHIDPSYIGLPFEGGDQNRALEGEAYLSDASPEHFEEQRRAFHPVFDTDGTVLGFVMASSTHTRIHELRESIYSTYIKLFLVLFACTLIFSLGLAMYLGKNLRGVRPDDLLRVYLTQNDILNALDEGLVSFDNTGRVRLVNAAAAKMLGHREDLLIGQQVDDLLRSADGESLRDRVCDPIQSSRSNIIVHPVQLPDSNLWARQVLILADKSEVMRYAEELGGTRHMISAVHEHIISPVMQLIHNPNVAALILGKEISMREVDVELKLLSNSHLPERSRYLSSRELVTVVGNLLENAMEAINASPAGGVRSVVLQITEDEKGLFLMVSDTGEGIREEDLPHIFESGFSTKASTGRGIGMHLIGEITDRHGGSIDVDTEPGSGTTISIIFSRERGAQL